MKKKTVKPTIFSEAKLVSMSVAKLEEAYGKVLEARFATF